MVSSLPACLERLVRRPHMGGLDASRTSPALGGTVHGSKRAPAAIQKASGSWMRIHAKQGGQGQQTAGTQCGKPSMDMSATSAKGQA